MKDRDMNADELLVDFMRKKADKFLGKTISYGFSLHDLMLSPRFFHSGTKEQCHDRILGRTERWPGT